jgi:hypothetical protein
MRIAPARSALRTAHWFLWPRQESPPERLQSGREPVSGASEVLENIKNVKEIVASTGIEPVSGASEALILSIVLRGRLMIAHSAGWQN